MCSLTEIRGYPARLNRVVVLLFIVEKLETMFRGCSLLKALCHSSPPTKEITFIVGYCCVRTTTIFRKCNTVLNN